MTKQTSTRKPSKARKVDPAARRAEVEALHDKLTAQVEALRSSETWTAYLKFMASFHRYSFGNMLLIFAQCPEATAVAGFRAWQAKGRQVRKGERSIRILAPCTFKVEETDKETGETVEAQRVRFKPASVFDLSQTDPIPGHEDPTAVVQELSGDDEQGIIERVCEYLHAIDVPVSFEDLGANGPKGYTSPADEAKGLPMRVVISDRHAPAQQAKTLIHELAHIVLDHVAEDADYAAHRGRCEVEAESTAYVVAGLLGLDSSSYSTGYVAGWMEQADSDVLQETAANVRQAVHTIAAVLDAAPEAEDEHSAAA